MKQLTMGDIAIMLHNLKESGMSASEIAKLPIYLENDDELNGVHNGWYCELIDSEDEDDSVLQLINEDSCTTNLKGKGILIS